VSEKFNAIERWHAMGAVRVELGPEDGEVRAVFAQDEQAPEFLFANAREQDQFWPAE